MSHMYERALQYGPAALAAMDLRAMLVMTNTTCDTETEAQFIASFTTKDEYDGAAYARAALAAEAISTDLANSRVELHCDPIVFATLGVGTRQAAGVVILKHVTNDADSEPIFYIDSGGFPFDGNGENVTITPSATAGLAHAKNA